MSYLIVMSFAGGYIIAALLGIYILYRNERIMHEKLCDNCKKEIDL